MKPALPLCLIFAATLSTSLFAQDWVDRWTFVKPNAHNRMLMPAGNTTFQIPAENFRPDETVSFDITTLDQKPLTGVSITPIGSAPIPLQGNSIAIAFPLVPLGNGILFTVQCTGARIIEFNWTKQKATPQPKVENAPPPNNNDDRYALSANINTPVGTANIAITNNAKEERRNERREEREDRREDRRNDRIDNNHGDLNHSSDDNDDFSNDGRFTTLDRENAESKINLDNGKNYFEIPRNAMKRDWKWSKICIQISAEDNQPLDGIRLKTDKGSSQDLNGYSQQVTLDAPGKDQSSVFFIKSHSNRKIRVNWWKSN